jgi:hypothetical protein
MGGLKSMRLLAAPVMAHLKLRVRLHNRVQLEKVLKGREERVPLRFRRDERQKEVGARRQHPLVKHAPTDDPHRCGSVGGFIESI